MPLNAIDYSKTIIYKIQHKEKPELFYIGHTTNFDSRKYQHQLACNSKKHPSKGMLYLMIHIHGGWSKFEMNPIKQVECNNRIGALIEEQKAIDELGATLNYNSAYKSGNRKENRDRFNNNIPDVIHLSKQEQEST